jgi:hypothetical protein
VRYIKKNGVMHLRVTAADAARNQSAATLYLLGKHRGYTWQGLVGTKGHIGQLARMLAKEQQSFKADLQNALDDLGGHVAERLQELQIVGGHLAQPGLADWLLESIDFRLLSYIVREHVLRLAMIAAAIEWEMHQPRASTKDIYANVRKGVWDMIRRMPGRIADAVTTKVSGLVDVAEAIVENVKGKIRSVLGDMRSQKPAATRSAVVAVLSQSANTSRAAGIAVTEGTRAAGIGGKEACKELAIEGMINARRWATLHGTGDLDQRVRDSHRRANGQTIAVDGQFVIDSPDGLSVEYCDSPGDAGLSAGNRKNCRCLAIGVLI